VAHRVSDLPGGRELMRRIFVPQCDGEDALAKHRGLLMRDQRLIAWIGNDRVQRIDQAELAIDFAEQQRPRIRGDGAAGKIRDHFAPGETGKLDGFAVTLCYLMALPPCVSGCVVTPEQYRK